jgi:death-on-curing protein
MDFLVRNHPFMDGNKRTAITASAMFLRMNGYLLRVENHEVIHFTLACAQSQVSLEEIAAWFREFGSMVE